MKITKKNPPRQFTVKNVTLSHAADIELADDELVTFQSASGKEVDVAAKDWGYYLGGSTNDRMVRAGYKTVIAENPAGQLYILCYEVDKEAAFLAYLKEQKMSVKLELDT